MRNRLEAMLRLQSDEFKKATKGYPMSFALLRVSALALGFSLLAGCGGSSGGNGGGGGGTPTAVTFTFSEATPTAVAMQIGAGQFTAAMLSSGKLTLSLPSGTTDFTVAYVCPSVSGATSTQSQPSSLAEERVVEASTLDGTSFVGVCLGTIAPASVATGTLTGSADASAIPGANSLIIYAESAQNPTGFPGIEPLLSSTGDFSLAAPAGNDRVMVAAYSSAEIGNLEPMSLVAVKNFNSQTVPGSLNGGNTVVLGTADQTTPEPLTYQDVPSGYTAPTTLVDYQMGNVGIGIAGVATSEYPALPAGATESGDSYLFWSQTFNISNPSQRTLVTTTLPSAAPVSFAFPPAWPYAGPTPAAQPSFDLSDPGFSGVTGVFDAVEMNWSPTSNTQDVVLLTASGNYLNGSTTVEIPDLSGLPGFLPSPVTGTEVGWSAEITQGEFPSLRLPSSTPTIRTVSNSGSYTVP
jgi:hypothetical protein